MKRFNILINMVLTALIVVSCQPKKGKDEELPAPSVADFEIVQNTNDPSDKNTFTFKNTTPGAFITSWDFGGIAKSSASNETVFFGYKGTYKIKLLATSKGGTTTITKDLVIPENSPYAADFEIEKVGDFKFKVTSTVPDPIDMTFTYANGDSSKAQVSEVYFPFKGNYNITLKVKTVKGISSITKPVEVTEDYDPTNPDLNDPVVLALTGGLAAANGKTWVMIPNGKSGGVGPLGTLTPDWWNQPDGFTGPAWEKGMLTNEFTFNIRQYQYIPKNGNVTVHWNFAKELTGVKRGTYDDGFYSDPKHKQAPFIIRKANGAGTGYTLDFTNGSYLGYYDRRYNHEIVKISADTLFIRHHYSDSTNTKPVDDGGARYFTLVPKK
ncbi:hypothetical protein [Sporocytophaga myxococcoides]|uniref:hypothetical protein n=1 Tax=Sporocytophaga myxococcoides TaxID=153721 RepID=UPI00040A1912|nr:hypothetical protein [Sporocytophaga myxococcoides]